jgi:hypothetical protein
MKKGKKLGYSFIFIFLSLALVLHIFSFVSGNIQKISLTGKAIDSSDFLQNLLIPSALTSIFFSMIALITMIFLIFEIRENGVAKVFPFRGYLASISIVFIIFLINYFITLFPYGNLVLNLVSFVLQIMIYGVLLPYILVAQISYIVLLLRGNIRGILK